MGGSDVLRTGDFMPISKCLPPVNAAGGGVSLARRNASLPRTLHGETGSGVASGGALQTPFGFGVAHAHSASSPLPFRMLGVPGTSLIASLTSSIASLGTVVDTASDAECKRGNPMLAENNAWYGDGVISTCFREGVVGGDLRVDRGLNSERGLAILVLVRCVASNFLGDKLPLQSFPLNLEGWIAVVRAPTDSEIGSEDCNFASVMALLLSSAALAASLNGLMGGGDAAQI